MQKIITKKTTVREASVNEKSNGNRHIAIKSEQTEEKTVEIDQEPNPSGHGPTISHTQRDASTRAQKLLLWIPLLGQLLLWIKLLSELLFG